MTRSRTAGMIAAGVVTAAIGFSLAGQGVARASTDIVTDCSGSISDTGSLPYAVAHASPGDTITFNTSPSCGLITLTSTLTIAQNLTITGPGAAAMAVSGGGSVGVIDISQPGANVSISGLTIENGSSSGDPNGGGITNGGGIVTLTDSTVSGNAGGIDNSGGGSVTLTDSTVSGNNAGGNFNGINNSGGSVTLTGSTVSDNGTGHGGIDNSGGGSVTLTDSTVSGNSTADGYSGGIDNNGGSVTLTGSTVSGNTADGGGGGIGSEGGGSVTLTDSTVSGNTGNLGGGIYNNGGSVTLTDSTVSDNTEVNGGNGGIYGGGVTVGATIVAGNIGGGNCSGPLASVGYNLSDDNSCGFNQPGDLSNANPQLGPLGSYGGPTQVMVPQVGSPAIAVIPPGTTLNGVPVCPRTDQQGTPSAPGGNCTIGAVEVPTPPAVTTIMVTVSGSQAYGGGNLTFSQTNNAPAGTLSGKVTCATAGGSPLNSLGVGGSPYTLDGSSCSGLSGSGPGSYQITYQGAANGFTVTPAPLTITASSPSMTYGGTPPAITPGYSGFVNGDTASSLATAPSCSTDATSASPAGSYSSSCTGAADPNYTISYQAGTVTVTPAPTTLAYTGPQTITAGTALVPAATLASPASACQASQTVSFSLDTNPVTGAAGPYTLESATTNGSGTATGAPVSTSGWQAGAYTLTGSYAATGSCAASTVTSPLNVTTPGLAAAGAGTYPVTGAGTVKAGFIVALIPHTTKYAGTISVVSSGWWLNGTLTSYTKSSSTQGSATGTGSLYWWNQALNHGRGGWQLAKTGAAFTASFVATTKTSPGAFGIQISYTPVSPQPTPLPNSALTTLKTGVITMA